jgi:hypothetical protein
MRFRFTIRDLLWLTLVVAVGTGWWLDHRPDSEKPTLRFSSTIHEPEGYGPPKITFANSQKTE